MRGEVRVKRDVHAGVGGCEVMSKGWGRRRRRTTTTRRRTTTTKQKQQQNKNNIPTGGYSHAWAEACVAKLAKHRATTQNTALMAMLRRAVSLVVLFLPSAASCLLELCFNSLLLVLFSFLFFGWNGVGFSFFLSFFLSLGCLFDWSKRHSLGFSLSFFLPWLHVEGN